MHNGGIAVFPRVKRRLQQDLPDVAFDMVQGNTGMITQIQRLYKCWEGYSLLGEDSEWCFSLFLSKVRFNAAMKGVEHNGF